ncbi:MULTISPECIES: hypothetical protein [Paraburkholderia]|uniref:Uncharacterized protein n=1 Tax=Paraburkholderia podalyriae TaxID=1938811 RepID=A0ABR7Q1Z3_9BURK|nr:hypothetical protein [Paraburkholderia podalyriae]MBC8752451.1 hypothetical protein [Paraburkholderia podalyriae]
MNLDKRIALLSDEEGIGLLQRFSNAQAKRPVPAALDASVAKQMHEELELSRERSTAASDGEVARAALRLVASDPAHEAGIEALLDHPQGEKFVMVETAAVVSAALIALQTHVRFERDKQGQWTAKIEKKPTDSSLLKDLVKKLLSFS